MNDTIIALVSAVFTQFESLENITLIYIDRTLLSIKDTVFFFYDQIKKILQEILNERNKELIFNSLNQNNDSVITFSL